MRLRNRQDLPGRTGRHILVAVVALSAVAASSLILPGASAAPKPTVQQVRRAIDRLQEQAEQASEQYNETRENLSSINVRLRAAQQKLARQRTEVARSRTEVGRLASETYRRGQMTTLDVLLGDDPDEVLAQAGYLPSLTERQNGATIRLKDGEQRLVAIQRDIAQQQSRASQANAEMKQARSAVRQKLAQAQAQLSSLEASQRVSLRREQNKVETVGVPSNAGSSFCRSMADKASSSGARAALRFACAQLGEPYSWGSAGPGSWDCSGLTMKSWQAGGVSLPHSSRLQAGYGTGVSTSSLQPGDLIFFYSPISHVAIYLGDGLMVHAPHTGDVVRIAAVYASPTAAVRL